MLSFEHGTPASHPDGVTLGSQSCASPCPQAVWHCEDATSFRARTQQTWPGGQFAAPLHFRADVSPPGHPPSAPLHA
jgi:hypothetical protein